MADFDGLKPDFKTKIILVLGAVNQDSRVIKAGYKFVPGEGLRKLITQMAYFSRSRMAIENVKAMFKAAGLWAISDEDAAKKSTDALTESKHLKGEAQDCLPTKGGKVCWEAPKEVWEALGDAAAAQDLEWGGLWGKIASTLGWDCPHIQTKG